MESIDHQELARCLFDEANDAFFIFQPEDGTLVDANPAALRLTGFTHAKLLSMRLPDLFKSDDGTNIDELLDAFQNTGQFRAGDDVTLICETDAPLPVRVTASRIHTKPKPQGLAVVHDISHFKQAADARALRESERRFRTLAESLPISIGVFQDGRRIFANRYTAELTGYSHEELVGRQSCTLTHPDYRERMSQQLSDCQENGVADRQESKIVRKDGQERWVDFSTSPIDWNGRPATLGAGIDITDRKVGEQALVASEERYRRLVEN
jgi:PAS domain S-box-containing protein